MTDVPAVSRSWAALRQYTPARIALGRVGSSLPTAEVLDFSMAHARARDAVHLPMQTGVLAASFEEAGFTTLCVRSEAGNRAEYLKRPDRGRRLHPESLGTLGRKATPASHQLTIIVADGLSALASTRHALPLLLALRDQLTDWSFDSVIIATMARVALSDQIGELRSAEAAIILLGERPGLSSPDSLGAYLTYQPRLGRTDAERNCISNVRIDGMSYAEAAYRLHHLLRKARLAGRSGVSIKDDCRWESSIRLPADTGSPPLKSQD